MAQKGQGGHTFGQRQPPLYVTIQKILDKYPDGQIFKEIIQNADDAGANSVHFYLDSRQHGTNSVISHDLDRFQGPSLLAYNDAAFTDKDWKSIQDMQQSVKAEDPFKVGKFGIGFNSVYHITDLPTILSGNRLAYLDPHEEIWPNDTGQWYDIDKYTCCSDTFGPFENLCGFSFYTGTFAGTLFRFPLRNVRREKGVSSHLYDITKLRALLSALREEAKCILLFLRSVRTVKVFEIGQNGVHSSLLEVSIRETSSRDQLGYKRMQFQENLKRVFERQSYSITQQLDEVVRVQVDVKDYQNSRNSSQSQWLVGNRVGSQIEEVKKAAKDLKVFPWVGVALETTLAPIECGGGRVFCVLPMPIEVSCKLPVHVNGTFSLNDERRQLKWPSIERRNDQSAHWNHLLVEKLLPPCYASLLLQHAKMLLEPQQFYGAWPNVSKVRGTHWEGLLSPLLTTLFSESVISFCKPGGLGIPLWIKVNAATFVPRGTSLPAEVTTALVACGVKLVTVTDAIWNALLHCGITVTSVSPSLTRSKLKRSPGSYSGFSSHDKLELLRYCLSDNAYHDMQNLALLPLANGSFTTFDENPFSSSVYICTDQCPRYLLPTLDGELVDNEINWQIYMKLKAIADSGYTNLKVLTVNTVASLLPRAMPREWQRQNYVTMSHSTFSMAWFERFWKWVPGGSLSLFSNQLLVPVFNSQTGTHAVMRLSQTSPSLFIPIASTTHCSENLISALGKLGVKCCQQKHYRFIQHVTYLSSLMNYYSANGIVDAITYASQSYSSIQLTRDEANCLQTAVQGFNVTNQRVAILKSIPMFRTLSNTGERLYSVAQVEQLTSAQMEPLRFPLSAENLPSSVILFSSSDHQQRILLQSLSVYCTTTIDLLTRVLFPLIEGGSIGRNSSKKLMKEVLETFDVITSNTNYQMKDTFKSSISRLPFLPVSFGKPKAPNTLFSPDPELKKLYYQEPVFPLDPFSSGRCLSVLKSCGLKTKASPQEVVDIISSISSPANTFPVKVDEVKHTRARAILSYISKWMSHQHSESVYLHVRGHHKNMTFSDAFKQLSMNKSWLPIQCSPPRDYPTWLSWKGSGNSCHLVSFGSSVLLSKNQAMYSLACGSQMYFVEHSLQAALCNVFSPSPVEMVKHVMAHMEEVILRHSQCRTYEEVKLITQNIYRLLHKYERQVHMTMLECVWISKHRKFVHPHAIALEQNPSFRQNLEPFVYTLPGDLDEFASLFKALGVKEAVTKPQILGILETIKDGTSESLGVNSGQAWQLVMNILNWLTGSGEHVIEECDCDSIFVPVEPDTEWPTLVKGDDVVYTDSTFLQRYLESSDSVEDKYTFVNRRVSSQLAHQLRLTPLSKYLNISEDAFEDVGQSEPLTVRLKNILKDYKDGLTIIKEMLQNADDAGASEMNICFDTRYHTEKCESLFFPGMVDCHGPALVVNNNAMFTKEDFVNITKLAGATKERKALKIGKFGVGFCSVYHITDIPSFVSDNLLYIFDPTLTYLKDEIKNPARPGKKICFTSPFISRSKQLAPYVGLFGFDSQSRYKGTTFRFPFRTAVSELSSKIYTKDDVAELKEQIQVCSSKLLIFLRNTKSLTFSQIDHCQTSCRELMNITKTTQSLGSRCIHQITCSVSNSPSTTEYWLVETSTGTILENYSTASVACSLYLLPESGEQCYKPQKIDGEMFCFLPLSKKTGLPVHVSSNFAVSNNRRGIWTSDGTSGMSEEVKWNESLMETVISSAYCELLEGLKEMQTDSRLKEYEFFSMWPLQADLKIYNPWHFSVKRIYVSISTCELFFSVLTDRWMTMEDSKFLSSDILEVSHSSIPSAVLDIANHLQLPVVHLPAKYQEHLDLRDSIVTEETFLEYFFSNIDDFDSIMESRNTILFLALECYANELNREDEYRFCYLKTYLKANACIPCEPDGELLRKPDQLVHPSAHFAELYDEDEKVFPLKTFCDKKLIEEAMKDLGMLHKSIPLHWLEERAAGVVTLYELDPTKAMKRVKLIIECLLKEDQYERLAPESCTTIAGIAFLPVLPKPHDYPLPWKGKGQKLCAGNAILLKGIFHYRGDNTNMNIAGSQVVLLNQDPPSAGGCGFVNHRMQEILQIKTAPNCTEVIAHFTILIDEFESSPEMMKWADRMSRKVYEFLDNLLKQESESEVSETLDRCISSLTEKSCIWTGKQFVECRFVAQKWLLDGPYLYKVPESIITRKCLQKALRIKEDFSFEDLVRVLQSLKTDFGATPLPHNCQSLVKEILPKLPSQVPEENYGTIILPDSNFVMEEATKLFFDNMSWKAHDEDYRFVHPIVPPITAKALGVQLCRSASLSRYSIPGSQFKVMQFGQHEELTRRIQNIIRDYPFDMTILKELLQNADDAKATKMHIILDMRTHSEEHLLSEEWSDLQGPALLVWNDSVFSEQDLEGIQHLGLGSKRSDSETIGQYGIGFNAVYHLTDCPSFLTGGDTLCILDPHMRYVDEATDRHPGAMYGNLDDEFWNTYDGIKSIYLRDDLTKRPKELLGGSLFRFPLRHTLKHVQTSDIVKDFPGEVVISSHKMNRLLKDWAPQMKQSLLFLNNVTELNFFVIKDRRGILSLMNSYKSELNEASLKCRSDLVQKIKKFSQTKEPFISTYGLTIVESLMEKEDREEWLIQQGIGDFQNKVETWSYVEQVKPRHGIAAPLKRGKVPFRGQVFCFLPLPLYSELPVHINGHFILDSTRRSLWKSTNPERVDNKSYWNQNILQAIASSYAHFLEKITEYFVPVEGLTSQETLERNANNYYMSFPGSTYKVSSSERAPLSEPWLTLAKNVFQIMAERNSCVLAVPTASIASLKQGEDKYVMHWQPLKNEQLPQSQVYFCKPRDKRLRSILERIGMKITCAPLWIMYHFKDAKCEIPLVCPSSVFRFYMIFFKRVISDHFPCGIEDTPFMSIKHFKIFTEFLLEKKTAGPGVAPISDPPNTFPEEPFDYPLLLTADNQLRIFDKANKVLCSEYENLFPQCPDKFLHKELYDLSYSQSYFVSLHDDKTVCVSVVKELLESILPLEFKNTYVSPGIETLKSVNIKMLWQCFRRDIVFKSVLGEVLKIWALLLTKDNQLFRRVSDEQLLPIIPLSAVPCTYSTTHSSINVEVSIIVEQLLKAPFLDTNVVPFESVSLICPQFSDPMRMLKNLYYLHREFPFTEKITIQKAGVLVHYFAKIHLQKERNCCQMIKTLPLFETISGILTSIEGKKVYIWPGNICQEGIENWLGGTDLVFLNPLANCLALGASNQLGMYAISAEETYIQFIFPKFFKLNKEQRYNHLRHIRECLFNENFVKQKNINPEISYPAKQFVSALKQLPCIGNDGTSLQLISSFYTHRKEIFTTFPEHFKTLPKDIFQREEQKWMTFFLKLGLQESVKQEKYLTLCNDVANGKLKGKTKTASRVLLDYLFSIGENRHHGFHKDVNFLRRVSQIAFVCPVSMPELEWIHPGPKTSNCVILADEKIPLCQLSGSCFTQYKQLVWTVVPITLVGECEPKGILEGLGIIIEPSGDDVIKNIKNLSQSCFADKQLLMQYSAPHCTKDQLSLMNVFSSMLAFLQGIQGQINVTELEMIPCIPVYAKPSRYPVLVKPCLVVCMDKEETEIFYPFIHSVPDEIYVAKELLTALGVKSSLQLRHMQIVLESLFTFSDGLELEPNSVAIVKFAVKELISLLTKNKENRKQSMGEDTITEALRPLYFSGTDRRMHHVDSLVYSSMNSVDLTGTNLHLLSIPRTSDMEVKELCKLLPAGLRPKPLLELCSRKVSESVEFCGPTECVTSITNILKIPALSVGMCAAVRSVTKTRELVADKFEEHLHNFLQTLQICCVELLMIDIILKKDDICKVIKTEARKCFIQEQQSSYSLYLDSNVTAMDISDVRRCIAETLVSGIKNTQLDEGEYVRILLFLEHLLCANTSEDVYKYLREKDVHTSELDRVMDFDIWNLKLGDAIPRPWHFRLDTNNNNIFRPQEYVGYEITDREYIFAMILHPVELTDSAGQLLRPMHIKYKIIIRDDDEEGKKVKAIELSKFTMGKKLSERDNVTSTTTECSEVVPFEGDPENESSNRNITQDLEQAEEEIRNELRDIQHLPESDRKKAIRRLYLKWHPDKNQDNVKVAEEAFKFLIKELDSLEKNEPESCTTGVPSWRSYQDSWNSYAREQKHYSEKYTSQNTSNHQQQGSSGGGGGGSSRGGGGGGGGGFCFTPPRNLHEAQRWVRQAEADSEALEALLNSAQQNYRLSAHVCFMAHEVAEKALKGGMYATCGLRDEFLKVHKITPLSWSLKAERPEVTTGLVDITSPLEPYYLETRFPNQCPSFTTPSEYYTLDKAEGAAECARGVLKIVKDIMHREA